MEHDDSPAGRRSRSDGKVYGPEELAAMAAELRALPPVDVSKRRRNKQGAIRYLADEIAALQERGYMMEEITERLKKLGLEIATPTLKSYLQRAKDGGRKPKARGRRRRGAARQPATQMQTTAKANEAGDASSVVHTASVNPAGAGSTPKVVSPSSASYNDTAPTAARVAATTDATTRTVTAPFGDRPLPPPGIRIETAVPAIRPPVTSHDRKDAS